MRFLFGLSTILLLSFQLSLVAEQPTARTALDRYYAERLKQPFLRLPNDPEPKVSPPPWEVPFKQLASEKVEERRAGAAYLRELLALSLEDETSGKAPWRNTPYWGGGADVPARDLRDRIADQLPKTKPCAEVLQLLKWYLEHERMDRFLGPVLATLGKHDGEESDALRVEIASKPHPNAIVAAEALKQIAARKKTLPAEALASLCHHHRKAIRDAARSLNKQQSGKDPGVFDPAKAIRAEPVTKLMDRVLKLMPDLPPPKAEFVTVTVRYLDDKKAERQTHEETGWLIKNEKGVVVIHTPHGRLRTLHDKQKTNIWVYEETPTGRKSVELPVTTELTVKTIGADDLLNKVVASRKGNDAGNELSEFGGLSGQFRGSGATLLEALLGAWLYRAGKDEDAAKVLLPALDSVYRDEHLVFIVRDQLGELVGHKMLVSFVGDRDYTAAIKHAKLIDELYPNTRFHPYAKDFLAQLPKRMDDFTKLKLPTAKEWADLKKKLTRDEQIDFLCERLRLLNCFQMSQPGGCDPGETQYAEPCGLSENAAWGGGRGKTEVINPLIELRGARGGRDEDKPKHTGLELTIKDIPRLSKFLRHDHYMLMISFGRDFAPGRSLDSTREYFAGIINGLAKRDLVREHDMARMTEAEIDAHIQKIAKWGTENANKAEQELLWESLEEDVKAGAPWGRLNNAWRLIELKDKRMLPVLRKYLTETTSEYDLHSLLYWCRDYDPAAFITEARQFAKHKSVDLRLAAGYILFAGGERAEGTKLFADILEKGELGRLGEEAPLKLIETLLKEGSRESKATARLIFKNPKFTDITTGWVRASLVRQCAEAGLGEAYLSYIPLLDIKGSSIGGISYSTDTVVGELIATEIIERLAPKDPEILRIKKEFPKPADQIAPLKDWLRAKAKAVPAPKE
ncbi:MAG: hypothetical protein U0792_19675 [Gemmataceae bacterium]